jgi:ABC-type nitrate/sulfonate/bicarbonate transport system substrate-binding protein
MSTPAITVPVTGQPDPLAAGELLYTRCPVPTATGLAVGLDTLAPALRDSHDLGLLALQDVEDAAIRANHFTHGLAHLAREGGNIPALWAYASGAPTRLIGITWLDEYQAVVTSPGTSVDGVAGLAGRRVAIPASTGGEIDVPRASALRGFERALSTAGLDLAAVKIKGVGREPFGGPRSDDRGEHFDAELELLESRAVDAVWLKGAGGLAAVRERGLRELIRIDLQPDPLVRVNNGTPRTITIRQELLDARPEVVRTYLGVLKRAQPAVGDKREQLWRVLSRETHQPPPTAAVAYEQVNGDSLVPSLASDRIEALQHQAEFLFVHGFLPRRIDVAAWTAEVAS